MEKRKRPAHPLDAGEVPATKKAALALDDRQRERLRGDIRALYDRYEVLYAQTKEGADEVAFQALLDAAQGASDRLPPPPPPLRFAMALRGLRSLRFAVR